MRDDTGGAPVPTLFASTGLGVVLGWVIELGRQGTAGVLVHRSAGRRVGSRQGPAWCSTVEEDAPLRSDRSRPEGRLLEGRVGYPEVDEVAPALDIEVGAGQREAPVKDQ